MTPVAPHLFQRDVTAELQIIHQRAHRSRDTAIYGSGDPGEVTVDLNGTKNVFRVVPARCELELRHALAQRGKDPLVLLIDYDTELPADVQGRLAGGRVHFVDSAHRLSRVFGVAAASSELLTSPLAQALLAQTDIPAGIRVAGPTLDLATAWRIFLELRAGFAADGALSEDRILAFCASRPGGLDFARMSARWPGLADELHAYLERAAGPIARLAWESWAQGNALGVAAMAVLLAGAAEPVARDPYVQGRLTALIESVAPTLKRRGAIDPALVRRWGNLAEAVVRRLDAEVPGQADAVIRAAQELIPDATVATALAGSRLLPSAFGAAKETLTAQLDEAARRPNQETVSAALAEFERLRLHRQAEREPHRELVDRARMAVRLLMYLLHRRNLEAEAKGGASYEEMLLLAEDYAQQGGFVDYARRAARGSGVEKLGAAINAVVQCVDTLRDRDDEHFAQGLKVWISAGRKSDRVVPADAVLERLAVQFLRGGEHRKLLVLLLDGMAWSNAVELLLHLEGVHRFAPVRWRPRSSDPRRLLPPVLAAVPTLTNVSRSAIFAGRSMKAGETLDTAKDPERFSTHKGLAKLNPTPPTLLLRSDALTAAGHASPQALKLISSTNRVVGVVLNAIDDSLKVGPGMRIRVDLDTIKALREMLYSAADAGRAVLLLSDHGHVPGARIVSVPSASVGGATRWRPLSEGEATRDGEMIIEGDDSWHPKGKPRVAVLYRETDSYGTMVHEGEHGGASLAEVVAPAVLIASDNLATAYAADGHNDDEVEVAAYPRPRWWDLEIPQAPVKAIAASVPPPKPQKPTAQMSMPFKPARPTTEPVAASPIVELLLASPVFKGLHADARRELRDEIAPRVDALVGHGGQMAEDQFANRVGIAAWRVGGAVARMAELLNLDGYEVVVHDKPARQVRINIAMIKELFEGS